MEWNKGCACANWCRAEPQPITDKHHMKCPHYNDTVTAVFITVEGHGTYCDTDIAGALQSLADGDAGCYKVEIKTVLQREIDAMPEFDGF